MNRLPPLSALRAFEAAARQQSFKRAAQELHVTPTAVSHQIRFLEQFTGTRLFDRHARQVSLTTAGQLLLPFVRSGFDSIGRGLIALEGLKTARKITITATTAFTSRWLVPRISKLREQLPDLNLRLLATEDIVSLQAGEADLAIRYGQGQYPGHRSEMLLPGLFAPAFSPGLELRGAEDLARTTLIQFKWRHPTYETPTWQWWFEAAGAPFPENTNVLELSDELLAIEAAIQGNGAVMASLPLIRADLESGRLVAPFQPHIEAQGYFVVTSSERSEEADLKLIREWLQHEASTA